MGVSPTPPGDDLLADASWTETPVEVLLEQARAAAAGGDLPRARVLVESLRRRASLSDEEQVETWTLQLETAVLDGRHGEAEEAVDALARQLPRTDVRQVIRMLWVRHGLDIAWETELLDRADANANAVESESVTAADPPPAPSVLQLLAAIAADENDDVGPPDPESVRLFTEGPPLYTAEEIRSPVDGKRAAALIDEYEGDALPLLVDANLETIPAEEIHRVVADHPGIDGRELLRRYVQAQARLTSPQDLAHSYDVGLDLFGQDRFEEAAHLLLPVAMHENPERLGALELLTRSLFELDRLDQAEAYLREAIPVTGFITDPAYAPLFYWLGRISEGRDAPGPAIEYYAATVRLDPDVVEAKSRLQVLLGL
jgi:tetratricopeptide (TPR) repeat protein